MSIRFDLLAVLSLSVPLALGCSATCEDACTVLEECTSSLGSPSGQSHESCVQACEELDCGGGEGKQEFLDCVEGMDCEDQRSAVGELLGCASHCPNALN